VYATTAEFFRLMQITNPTTDQTAAANRCLDAAAGEINSYLGTAIPAPGSAQLDLLASVNLDRASDHWRLTPYGMMNQGPDMGSVYVRLDPFERHRASLQSLKVDWGVG
jgi:hypothetical protein